MPSSSSASWPPFEISLPDWVEDFVGSPDVAFSTVPERMDFVIRLAAENVRRQTGGPFGAAVFEIHSGRLVAPGVNRVVPARWSSAHAEIVACALAQQKLGTHDLGAHHLPALELVSSVEPCAMCLGAVPWSGVQRLVFGARDADARAIGFNEGHKPRDWPVLLRAEGIQVLGGILRENAVQVLRDYAASGGPVYNPRSS